MKMMKKLGLVAVFALATLNTYAIDGDFLLNVKKGKGNEISFSLNGIEKANIAIYDAENNLIYSEKAKGQHGIVKNYNLDELPMGTYTLVVKTDLKEVTHEIKVAASEATLSKRAYLEVYKTSFVNNNVASN
nr:FimB/Mfa2 family fimbrial subunit [uncultured Flavobacterium sp.]